MTEFAFREFLNDAPLEWITSGTWCCFLSLTASFLQSPVLDVFVQVDIDVELGGFVQDVGKPIYVNSMEKVESGNDAFVPIRKSVTDTIFFAKSIPPLYITGNHGKVLVITDDITAATILWTRNRLLEATILHTNDNKVGAYTWFPYKTDQCTREPTLERIDVCNNCSWTSNLYPGKLPRKFNGCPLRYDSFPYPPNVYLKPDGTLRGREIKFMEAIAFSHGFSVEYVPDKVFFPPTLDGRNPTGAMGTLLRGEADFAFSTLTMQAAYYGFCQPLHSYREGLVVWMLPTPRPEPVIYNAFSGFSKIIWLLILITFLVMTVLISVLAHIKEEHITWLDVILLTVASPMRTTPHSWLIRLILACMQFYCLHIVWFYQSTLLGNLFSTPMEKQMTLEEAVEAGLLAILRIFMSNLFNVTDHQLWNKILASGANTQLYDFRSHYHLVVEEKSAFMMAMEANENVFLRQAYPETPLTEMVYTIKEPLANFPITAYGRRGCPLTRLFSKQILHLIESGLFDYWTSREPEFAPFSGTKSKANKPISIGLLHAVFCFNAFSLFVILLVFFVELLSHRKPFGFLKSCKCSKMK